MARRRDDARLMVDRPRYLKSGCIVPFCRRTSTLFKGEWVCGEHWKLVDRSLKAYRTKRLKQITKAFEKEDALTREAQRLFALKEGRELEIWKHANRAADLAGKWRRVEALIWRKMKRQAIERAASWGG
jgi:hypothetical protein